MWQKGKKDNNNTNEVRKIRERTNENSTIETLF